MRSGLASVRTACVVRMRFVSAAAAFAAVDSVGALVVLGRARRVSRCACCGGLR